MDRRGFLAASVSAAAGLASINPALGQEGGSDWRQWRGPTGDGKAAEPAAKVNWSENQNVVWKTPVTGRGHSSPIVVGDRIYLATADEPKQERLLLAFDRKSGQEQWRQRVHRGGMDPSSHQKNSHASSTAASDGERVYIPFFNSNQIVVSAYDLEGKPAWQKPVGRFNSRFGFSASPTIYKGLVILAVDFWQGGGYVVALEAGTGKQKWKQNRPDKPSYASAIVQNVGGKDQLLLAGCEQVSAFDPATGKPFWSVRGTTESCVGTPVVWGELVIASGGYPGRDTVAIRATGRGQVVWRDSEHAYVPSLVEHNGYLYQVNDGGVGLCREAATGKVAWTQRIGGNFSASPTVAGDFIFIPAEDGRVIVFKANPSRFEKVAENRLGQEAFATPTICGRQIFLRAASHRGGRQDYLYCIG